MTLISGFLLSWGRNGCLRHAWSQATWSKKEVLHPRVQTDATITNLLPAKKNNLIKKTTQMHQLWNQDTNIHSIPVVFGDAVEDERFVFVSVSECGPQTVGPSVAEKQPVSYTELGQQTSLHHLIQIISRRTPQTAGEQRLFCAHLLRKQHTITLLID